MLPTGKGKELSGEFGAALGRGAGASQKMKELVVLCAQSGKLDVADHGCEQIVEIMRHSAGELADHLQFLGLSQALLDLPAFGHIPERARQADGIELLVSIEMTFGYNPMDTVIRPHNSAFELKIAGLHGLPKCCVKEFAIVREDLLFSDRPAPPLEKRAIRGKTITPIPMFVSVSE
jgi:hypothetical protein